MRNVARAVALLAATLVALAGCSFVCGDLDAVVRTSDSQPGSLRVALRTGALIPHIAARPGGKLACLSCNALFTLDGELREVGRMDAHDLSRIAVGPDDTTYGYIQQRTKDGRSVAAFELVAFDAAGVQRWRTTLDDVAYADRFAADTARLFVEQVADPIDDGPPTVRAFDAATGALLWTRTQRLLGAAHDGVFTAEFAPNRITLRKLDDAGAAVWERGLTSTSPVFVVFDVAATPDGGGIFVGRSEATVDLGDRTISGTPGRTLNFVFALDAAGATQWSFVHPGISGIGQVALTDGGDILIAGGLDYREDENRSDAFVALATPSGVVRTHRIGGAAFQQVDELVASPDGLAWLQVWSGGDEDAPASELRVAGHALGDAGAYLLAIVP